MGRRYALNEGYLDGLKGIVSEAVTSTGDFDAGYTVIVAVDAQAPFSLSSLSLTTTRTSHRMSAFCLDSSIQMVR